MFKPKGIEQTIGEAIEYILYSDNQLDAFVEVSRQMITKGEATYSYFFGQYMAALAMIEEACV